MSNIQSVKRAFAILKVIAARETLERYLARPLEHFTSNSIIDADILRQQLAEIRRQGFAWAREEFERWLVGVSAPVQNKDGQVIAQSTFPARHFVFPRRTGKMKLRV